MNAPRTRLGAIVVSYRTGPVLTHCLRALIAAADVDEIVLVDNGNSAEAEAEIDAIAAQASKLRVMRGHGNVGFGAGCNRGAAIAAADVVMFVNPDVVLNAGAAVNLIAPLANARAPAVVGGDLRDLDGQPDRGSRRDRVTMWRALVSFSGLSRFGFKDLHRHHEKAPKSAIEVGAVSGALMALRRADFNALGGFDEGYFLHVEDIDLCRRVEEAGGAVLFQSGPHGVHHRSSSDTPSKVVERYKAQSFARYFRKFARSPVESLFATLIGWALIIVLPLRAR